jgi:hypothetical protein
VATGTTTGTTTVTTSEHGSDATTSYTLTDVDTSTVTTTQRTNLLTGVYTLTRDGTTGSSLHEEGAEGTAGNYALDKTSTSYDDSTTTGDPRVGGYTLGGTFGSTSTATETNYHATGSATFTEVLTEDGTTSETGNGNTGDYSRHQWGDQTANFVQGGMDAAGSAHVTEGGTGTFDRSRIGNSGTGGYSLHEATATDYSATETVNGSETYTLTDTGSDGTTADETGDDQTGGYSRGETGTDGYTLSEWGTLAGGAVTETVTGTDDYGVTETGNHAQGTYDQTTTGGGAWVRTGSGASSGSNGYTQAQSGDDVAGHFSQSVTGTDRYGLVDRFDDVSNTAPGTTTPGNVTLHSHGLPFRDPGGVLIGKGDLAKWREIEAAVRATSSDKSFHFLYVPVGNGDYVVTIPDADKKPEDVHNNIAHHLTTLAGASVDERNQLVVALYGVGRELPTVTRPGNQGFTISKPWVPSRPGPGKGESGVFSTPQALTGLGSTPSYMTAGGAPVYKKPKPSVGPSFKLPGTDWMNEPAAISPYSGEVISRLDFFNEVFLPFMVPAPGAARSAAGPAIRGEGIARTEQALEAVPAAPKLPIPPVAKPPVQPVAKAPIQIDNNLLSALVNPADPGHANAVAFAQANGAGVLNINRSVYQEFLKSFSKDQFSQLANKYDIRLIREHTLDDLAAAASKLQKAFEGDARVLTDADARALASAWQKGEKFFTNDKKLYKRAKDLGLDVEFVGDEAGKAETSAYVPRRVAIPK